MDDKIHRFIDGLPMHTSNQRSQHVTGLGNIRISTDYAQTSPYTVHKSKIDGRTTK